VRNSGVTRQQFLDLCSTQRYVEFYKTEDGE
jgi:hypothetical protein